MEENMKTPGVYIQELDAFGNAVVPVPTAVPAFIGYTAQISYNGKSLLNKAVKVTSLAEFLTIFGTKPPQVEFSIVPTVLPGNLDDQKKVNADFMFDKKAYKIAPTTINYRMYSSIKFFYENGGADCYIVTIGSYDYSKPAITDTAGFVNAITLLKRETEPTMLVIPDVVEIMDPNADPSSTTYLQDKYNKAYSLQNEMINHCGDMMNRVAILDIPGGYSEPLVGTTHIDQFRNCIEPCIPKFKSYAAAYYPWLHTTVYQKSEINFLNISKQYYEQVTQLLNAEFTDTQGVVNSQMAKAISAFSANPEMPLEEADLILQQKSKSYQLLMGAIMEHMNLIAPGAAMAGIYNMVDNNEGVWVAPANVGVQSVVSPSIKIDDRIQEDLNVPIDGKSVCAIRAFTGRGCLVWGARTLDGNSNDWRYINVRRTLIYIEQSAKQAASAYIFAPNDASTWVSVKSMLNSFLTGLWKQGGLVGAKAADAFLVSVGLGSTMTADDILNGIMRVAIKVAVSHPGEFIEITFQQEMQKG